MSRIDAYKIALEVVQIWLENNRGDNQTSIQQHLSLQEMIAHRLLEAEQLGYYQGWNDADMAHINGEMKSESEDDGGDHGLLDNGASAIGGNELAE